MLSQPRDRSFTRLSSKKLLEPESVRLQNDIEALTKAMGLQRRRTASLDERLQHFSKEILVKKDKLSKLMPSNKEEQILQNKLMVLDNQLCKEQVVLNKALVDNERLRERIDSYRREKVTLLSVFKAMQTESSSLADQAEEANRVTRQMEDEDKRMRRELMALKHRSEEKMDSYQSRSALLQVEIEQDRHVHRDVTKSVSDQLYPDSLIFFDNNLILKSLYSKWTILCKEQKKAVDQYNRTVRYLSDAFLEIKEATGLSSIGEMVTGLVKAQEQEKALLANLNKVMAQADDLESRLSELRDKHTRMVTVQRTDLVKNEEHLSDLSRELAGLRSLLLRKTKKQTRVMQEVESIQPPINGLLAVFQESQLQGSSLNFAEKALVRGADVMTKLAELEKAILFMVEYISIGEKVPLPAVFETGLVEKEFSDGGRNAITPVQIDDPEYIPEIDRPLSALEIRQRTRQKFYPITS